MRVISYNILACRAWPTDKWRAKAIADKNQIIERLALELGLYDADIITFSESGSEAQMKKLASLLDMNFAYFPSAGNWPGSLLTVYDIKKIQNVPVANGARPGDCFTRHWGKAQLQLNSGKQLIVHSAHLYPHLEPENCAIRQREVHLMLEQMQGDLKADRSMLLMGDLNHTPDMKVNQMLTGAGLVDSFAQVGTGDGFTIKADNPKKRIDYIMAAGAISKTITSSRPLYEGAFAVNLQDKESVALSDHLPQMAEFDY